MFAFCQNLSSLDLSNFDTSKVQNMSRMFGQCLSLERLNLSEFNTSGVQYMDYMFFNDSKITELDLSNFDTSKVESMQSMFTQCSSLTSLNISSFNTTNVNTMATMFAYCSKLQRIYTGSGFVVDNVTTDTDMFSYSPSIVGSNGTKYDSNHVGKEYARIDGFNNKPGYFSVQPISYQVCIWGIRQDKCGLDGSDTANLTFGPATGETNACLDVDGHHEHCIHNES